MFNPSRGIVTAESTLEIRDRCRRWALRRPRYSHLADDFASHAALQHWEFGRISHRQLFSAWAGQEFGAGRSEIGREEQRINEDMMTLSPVPGKMPVQIEAPEGAPVLAYFGNVADRMGLEGHYRVTFLLTYLFGFTGQEAAVIIGKSLARVRVYEREIQAKLTEFYTKEMKG